MASHPLPPPITQAAGGVRQIVELKGVNHKNARKHSPRSKASATGRQKYSLTAMTKAITDAKGLLSVAARSLGCSADTIYRYAKAHPEIDAAIQDARNSITDMAEASLFKAIQDGQGWAVCFYLKCQGKARGYMETQRHEVTGAEGGPIQLEPTGGLLGKLAGLIAAERPQKGMGEPQ